MVMMIGEMNYGDNILCPAVSTSDPAVDGEFPKHCQGGYNLVRMLLMIIYVVFLVFMSVIVMNLLTGLAVDDTEKIRDSADSKRRKIIIDKILNFEYLELPSLRWIRSLDRRIASTLTKSSKESLENIRIKVGVRKSAMSTRIFCTVSIYT